MALFFMGTMQYKWRGLTAVTLLYEINHGASGYPDHMMLWMLQSSTSVTLTKVSGHCSKRHELEDVF